MTGSPFKFGLERVRELRVHDEDRAKEAFAASLGARVRGEALLRAAAQRLRDAQSGRSGDVTSGLDLARRQAWVERLERTRTDAEIALDSLDDELAHRRVQLTDASLRREVLDRLRERRRSEHRAAAGRAETAHLDEIGLRGFARQGAAR